MDESRAVVGLDVGSTTVKVAVRARADGPWVLRAARHRGAITDTLRTLCEPVLPPVFRLRVTGSSAPLVADRCGLPLLHEVTAAMRAAQARHPAMATLVDLGGQDAKLVLFDRVTQGAHPYRPTLVMNDRCAAGVGVTLDRCLRRLGIDFPTAAAMPYRPERVEALSARCGVFAETDLVNLARRGVPQDVLVSSLVDAIVRANLAVLARGVTPRPPVLLLGGPHAHMPALADAWRHHLGALWERRGVAPGPVTVPDDATSYPALGAALEAGHDHCAHLWPRAQLLDRLRTPSAPSLTPADVAFVRPPPVEAERPAWTPRPTPRHGPAFVLGIDAGSTVTKAVLLDRDGALRTTVRRPSGDPRTDAEAILAAAAAAMPTEAQQGVDYDIVVTGYGAAWMGPLVGASMELVETVAHAAGARAVAPEADLVCDIGGQDIKLLELDPDGSLRRFEVSSRCVAGIGMALESTAAELGVAREDFAARAFEATRAPWFGDGCTVFLDANRVSFQRQGFSPPEMLAGLARALPRVVFTQVVRGRPLDTPGRVIVLQGGVQHNAAAVQSLTEYVHDVCPDARVIVHPLPDLAGALGAALYARDRFVARAPAEPSTPARRTLPTVAPTLRAIADCSLCENHCPRAELVPEAGSGLAPMVLGHACDAGATHDPVEGAPRRRDLDRRVPDLFTDEASALFRADVQVEPVTTLRSRVRVGIPRALALYRAAPLLRAYLQALGLAPRDVVFSPATDDALWQAGAHHGANDPCFPAKVLRAHVHHLVTHGRPDVLFVPRVTQAHTAVRHCAETASCPVVAASPATVRAAFEPALAARGITLLDPSLDLRDPARLAAQLHEAWGPVLGVTRAASDAALAVGYTAVRRFDDALQARGRAVLDAARAGRGAVLVIARPYHVDPGLSHHLGAELQALGYPALSIRALPRDPAWLSALLAEDLAAGRIADPFDVRDLLPPCDNSGAAERLWGARIAARHGGLGVVDLSSFKCAQDAPTAAPIAALMAASGTAYCALHDLDETRPRASLRLALRSLAHSLRARSLTPWT